MATQSVFVGKLWNDVEKCYETVKFIHVGVDKVRGINVLLIGLEENAKQHVVLQPTWIVREWMQGGAIQEMPRDEVLDLMRACGTVPPFAKKIWNEVLSV